MRKNWYKWNTANNMKPKTGAHTSFVHSPLRLLAYCKPFQIRFSIHSCSGWENCNGHSASRGSSAVAEFLVETLGSSRRMRKGLFTAHELSWPDLHQDDPVTRRVHWSRASAKLGQLVLSQFRTHASQCGCWQFALMHLSYLGMPTLATVNILNLIR